MLSSGLIRWGGLAGMLSGMLGIVLAPILTYVGRVTQTCT
jgi:hypothetical protein